LENSDAIDTGNFGHKLMEIFYRAIATGSTKEEALLRVRHTLPKHKEPFMIRSWVLVENYVNDLDIKGTAVAIEESFVVETEYEFNIGFTPDLIWWYNDKRLDVEDYKFVQRAWSPRKKARYTQLDVYRCLLLKHGLDVRKGILRFFNVTTGQVDLKEYTANPFRLERMYYEFITAAQTVHAFKNLHPEEQEALAIRTLNYNTCQWCDFEYPCNLELDGKSAEKTLQTQFKDLDYGYERAKRTLEI
jgi:PD-(D/E)XK nuclease superfamily